MADAALLKDQLDQQVVTTLAGLFKTLWAGFDERTFITQATEGLDELELKARVKHIIQALSYVLPTDFTQTATILKALAQHADTNSKAGWHSFMFWPVIDYVAEAGIEQPALALEVLEKLTPLFTAEFALRPFLDKHFTNTHQQLQRWTQHQNEHVRRLASESIRPRLPWATQLLTLKQDPTPIWAILEALKNDESMYVRRSVANNLNDISKDHPEQVLAICAQWQQAASKETQWVIQHGLRSLIKQGHPDVFTLLGYSTLPTLRQCELVLSKSVVEEGESLTLELHIEASEDAYCVLDYKVGFVGAKGQTNWKVFKWQSVRLAAGQTQVFSKTHPFLSYSTRRLYPGRHQLQCLLNGVVVAEAACLLVMP